MVAACFCRNELHVFEKDGDHGKARFLGDVIETRLTGADAKTVAPSAFGKNDEVKFVRGAAKFLEFANAPRIEFAAFEKKANAAAENPFNPGVVPDGFVAQNKNRITTRTPAESAEQNGVEEADVIADEKVPLRSIEAVEPMGSAQIWNTERKIRADAE
jgi:hypothetical protein